MKRGDIVTKEKLTATFMDMYKQANSIDETQIAQLTSLQVFTTYEDGGTTYVSEKLSTLNNQFFNGVYELGTTNLLFQSLYDEIQKVL